jgi:hypothetical protein
MAYAARVMRGLIIDHVRNRLAINRGGQFELTSLTTDAGDVANDDHEFMRISHALDELSHVDSSLSQIVDLKFSADFLRRNFRHARFVCKCQRKHMVDRLNPQPV